MDTENDRAFDEQLRHQRRVGTVLVVAQAALTVVACAAMVLVFSGGDVDGIVAAAPKFAAAVACWVVAGVVLAVALIRSQRAGWVALGAVAVATLVWFVAFMPAALEGDPTGALLIAAPFVIMFAGTAAQLYRLYESPIAG